jgi:hypothetical protein
MNSTPSPTTERDKKAAEEYALSEYYAEITTGSEVTRPKFIPAEMRGFKNGILRERRRAEVLISAVEETIRQMNKWSCPACSSLLSPVMLENALKDYRAKETK